MEVLTFYVDAKLQDGCYEAVIEGDTMQNGIITAFELGERIGSVLEQKGNNFLLWSTRS